MQGKNNERAEINKETNKQTNEGRKEGRKEEAKITWLLKVLY
jgi:hypothetical protein